MKKIRKHDGVQTTPYKIEKVYGGLCEYRKIQAFQACNYDGTLAGYEPGTPEGDSYLIEKRFIPISSFESVRFTNYW